MEKKAARDLKAAQQSLSDKMKPLAKKMRVSEEKRSEGVMVKLEPGEEFEQEPGEAVRDVQMKAEVKEEQEEEDEKTPECEMSKSQLIAHHHLDVLRKNTEGKKNPVFCRLCNTTFEGRNRARIWQHVKGQQHQVRLSQKWMCIDSNEVKEEVPHADSKNTVGSCDGLRLNGSFGKLTRLGTDLRECWDIFSKYSKLSGQTDVQGRDASTYTHILAENDWVIRRGTCQRQGEVQTSEDGESKICQSCLELGNNRKYLTRICLFVVDVDLARLLHARMYQEETVEALLARIRNSACYTRRCKSQYDKHLDSPLEKLHFTVSCTWRGRMAHAMNQAMEHFFIHIVKPCIDVEPFTGMKGMYLEKLLKYMSNDPNTPQCDMQLVSQVVTGSISRHPGLHGMLAAIAEKLQNMETGKTRMRNPHSALASFF